MADRIGHGHHGKAESERDAEKADADLRKAGSDDGASTSSERQPEGTDRLGNISSVIHSGPFLSTRFALRNSGIAPAAPSQSNCDRGTRPHPF